jgi:hypothetical protein
MAGFASSQWSGWKPPTEPADDHDALGFLHGVFDDPLPDEVTWCLAATWEKGYAATRWRPQCQIRQAWRNGQFLDMTHYCVSAIDTGSGKGWLSRKSSDWRGLKVYLLDDVYEKAAPPVLEPTFKIETSRVSKRSEQWGYVFEKRLLDHALADQLIRTLRAGDASDPGGQNLTRVSRLPGSLPAGKTERAKLISYTARRFDPTTILAELGVTPALLLPAPKPYKPQPSQGEFLGDPVLDWLAANGHLRSATPEPSGAYLITCPWRHDSGDESGVKYWPATAEDTRRRYKCHHGSCAHRKTKDFLGWVRRQGGPA